MLLTKRLILRNWKETDAIDLYFLASNVKILSFVVLKGILVKKKVYL